MCGKIKHATPKYRNKPPKYQDISRERLRKYFKEQEALGITRKMVARQYGIKVGTIYGWLRRGHTGGPTLAHHGKFLIAVIYPQFSDIAESVLSEGIPSLLREFRKFLGFTLEKFAAVNNINLNTAWQWETGKKGSPSLAKHYTLVCRFLWWAIVRKSKEISDKKLCVKDFEVKS